MIRKHRRGSLLIEALLGMTIIAVSLSVIIQSLLGALKATALVKDHTIASFLIENKFFELNQVGYVDPSQERYGSFPEPFHRYEYYIAVEDVKGQELPKYKWVQLKIQWREKQKVKNVFAASYLLEKNEDEADEGE